MLEPVWVGVNGHGKPATDTDGDATFEDVDGNEEFTVFDVQSLFAGRVTVTVAGAYYPQTPIVSRWDCESHS